MHKILFLDIDGVLNTKFWYSKMDEDTPRNKWGYVFDPMSVANLKRIVDETGAEIVISSSWKCVGLHELRKMWKARKLPGRIIDITPDIMTDEDILDIDLDLIDPGKGRGDEIKKWLSRHEKQVSHYAIIDDMYEMLPEQQSHTRIDVINSGMVLSDHLAMIDSQKCFMIDKNIEKKIVSELEYETIRKQNNI